jgi:hypothetical protein
LFSPLSTTPTELGLDEAKWLTLRSGCLNHVPKGAQ